MRNYTAYELPAIPASEPCTRPSYPATPAGVLLVFGSPSEKIPMYDTQEGVHIEASPAYVATLSPATEEATAAAIDAYKRKYNMVGMTQEEREAIKAKVDNLAYDSEKISIRAAYWTALSQPWEVLIKRQGEGNYSVYSSNATYEHARDDVQTLINQYNQ